MRRRCFLGSVSASAVALAMPRCVGGLRAAERRTKKFKPKDFDGGSLRDVFEKGNAGTVRRGTEALVFHFPWYNGEPESAIRLGDFKLLENLDTRKLSLFNLAEDIAESKDLAAAMPAKTAELHKTLHEYLKAVGAEDVQTLRRTWRKRVVEQLIPEQEKRLAQLRAHAGQDSRELGRTEKYLKWLRQQVIFTDNRLRLHEQNRKRRIR